jgi:heat shock protein HslJ
MQWTLKDMTVDGKEFKLTGEMPFVKLEKDGRITGFASINRFFGSMTIDDKGEVKWPSSLGATRMAGPPALMTQEDAFLKALVQTGSVAIERIYLYMTSADNKTTLTFYVPVR